jgi:hypothetical protein
MEVVMALTFYPHIILFCEGEEIKIMQDVGFLQHG